jgi:hypothetical protein
MFSPVPRTSELIKFPIYKYKFVCNLKVFLVFAICATHSAQITLLYFFTLMIFSGPPLWSSGQSSWLQIRRPGFDSRHYQKKVVGLERGPLSLVSTNEDLLDRKVAAPV